MLPTKLKSFWAGIVLLCAALLPWQMGFATVTDEQIQAAKEYHVLLANRLIPQDYQTPDRHLTYLQTLVNGQYEQQEKLSEIAAQLIESNFELTNGNVINNIQRIVEYLQNPPVPDNLDELVKMIPSASKYIQGEITSNKMQKRTSLLKNIQNVMNAKHPSIDIIEMDRRHDDAKTDGGGLNHLYDYLDVPLYERCSIM